MMAPNGTKKISFLGFKIHYESHGHGKKALVFVHGWTCDSSFWFGQSPLMQEYRSILIDLPGHGKSDAPDINYHQEFLSEAVEAVLEEEGIESAVIIAHSMGGAVATMLLRRVPSLVKGIVYVDSFFRSPDHYSTRRERERYAETLKGDRFSTAFDYMWTEKSEKGLREMVGKVSMSTPEHVRIRAIATHSLPHAFRGDEIYDIPALDIDSGRFEVDKLWQYHIPNLKIEKWEGSSHFLFMEDPERFNAAVEKFLKDNNLDVLSE